MRKLFVLVLAVVLAVAIAVPAMAYQVKVGGRLDTDIGYIWQTGNSYGNSDSRMPDLTTFYIGMPVTNYFRIDWMSNDKSTGGRIEVGIGAGGPALGHGGSLIALRYMYGWYKFGRCRLVIGHDDNLLASLAYAPYQWFGLGAINTFNGQLGGMAPIVLYIGMGKQYSGRFAQIALYYDVGPWTFMVALGQAATGNANNPVGIASVANTVLPRLDLVVKYKGKYIGLAPGFSIYSSEREAISGASLQDDRILSYLLVLPFRISFGNFRIKGELSYGMNWVAANYFASMVALSRAVYWGGLNDAVRVKTEDTYQMAACLGLEYFMGRVSLHLGGGWVKYTNASNDQNGTWRHGQNVSFGFNFAVRYTVNKHFVIAPEIQYWVYGWNPFFDTGAGNAMFADMGQSWLAGISFQIRF
jgi:hypothetical protein